MNKFVKRYPRAVIRRSNYGFQFAHILHHPAEKPDDSNVVGFQYQQISPANLRKVIDTVKTYRSEPS
jgi:hypothetical protein